MGNGLCCEGLSFSCALAWHTYVGKGWCSTFLKNVFLRQQTGLRTHVSGWVAAYFQLAAVVWRQCQHRQGFIHAGTHIFLGKIYMREHYLQA